MHIQTWTYTHIQTWTHTRTYTHTPWDQVWATSPVQVVIPKAVNEKLGVVIVESGWGSMLPTIVLANLCPTGPAARCGQLNIGDQVSEGSTVRNWVVRFDSLNFDNYHPLFGHCAFWASLQYWTFHCRSLPSTESPWWVCLYLHVSSISR